MNRRNLSGAMNAGDFLEIERVVRETYNCATRYLGSRQVSEVLRGKTTWKGIVDIFTLFGHTKPQRCYAWQWREGDETKTITVLEIPPVVSADTAVKFAIASRAREKYANEENARVLTEASRQKITKARDLAVPLQAARERSPRFPEAPKQKRLVPRSNQDTTEETSSGERANVG